MAKTIPNQESRRGFLKKMGFWLLAAAGAITGIERLQAAVTSGGINNGGGPTPGTDTLFSQTEPRQDQYYSALPKRKLGRTGLETGLFSLGGEAAIQIRGRRETAETIINRALDLGVNYIDTSPTYGGGGSESNIGNVMAYRRKDTILATKTHDRTYDGTMRLFEDSLKRLQTDYIDVYQLHNIRVDSDLDRALAPNGAVKALENLKQQGAIGFIGITGHKDPEVLWRGIREYDFDTILMSLNAADIHYKPFQKELLKTATDKEMGIIAMKVTAVGRIFQEEGLTSMEQALGYVLTLPVSTAIIGISTVREAEENVRLARSFSPFSDEEMQTIAKLTAAYQRDANFFKHYW